MPLNQLDHKFGGWFLRRGRGCFIPHMGPILGPTSKYFTSAGLETFHLLSLPWVLCKANSFWCCWKRGMVRGQALKPGRNTCHHHVQVDCFVGFWRSPVITDFTCETYIYLGWRCTYLIAKNVFTKLRRQSSSKVLNGLFFLNFDQIENPRIIHCHTSTWDSMQIVHLLLYRGFAVCSIEWCMLCCKLKGNAMQCSCLAWLQLFIVCDVRRCP